MLYKIESRINFILAKYLFSPDLDFFIDYDKSEDKFLIMKNNRKYITIPEEIISQVLDANDRNLYSLSSRVHFEQRSYNLDSPEDFVFDESSL